MKKRRSIIQSEICNLVCLGGVDPGQERIGAASNEMTEAEHGEAGEHKHGTRRFHNKDLTRPSNHIAALLDYPPRNASEM
jgi:hypothetical protein